MYWHWLVIYGLLLALGLLGDVSSCAWGALPVVWAQLMPQIHYLGIVFAATRFGAPGGLAAACIVGVAHTMLLSTACNQATAASGHLAMFAAVGLLAGWIGKLGVPAPVKDVLQTPRAEEHRRDFPIAELGQLIPELVHQFRTPIASIAGAGFVLEDTDLSDDRRQEFVSIIRKECRRLELLVELLDFTHPHSIEYEDLDVVRLFEEVISQCRPSADLRVKLQNMARQDLPRLRCAPDLIKYALQILTMDTVHAISDYGEVELSAALVPDGMAIRVRAHPEHDGPPLEAALIRDRGRSDLAVVRQIANQHGGSVQVEPSTDGSVTISMILPIKRG